MDFKNNLLIISIHNTLKNCTNDIVDNDNTEVLIKTFTVKMTESTEIIN